MKKLVLLSLLFLTCNEFGLHGAQERTSEEQAIVTLIAAILGNDYDLFVKLYRSHAAECTKIVCGSAPNRLLDIVIMMAAQKEIEEDISLPFIRFLLGEVAAADIDKYFIDEQRNEREVLVSPLMMAAGTGNLNIVKLLLAHGVDKSLKNNIGNTAFDYAQEQLKESTNEFIQLQAADEPTGLIEQLVMRTKQIIELLTPDTPTAPQAPSNLPGATAGSGSNVPSASSSGGSTLGTSS